MAVIAAVCRVTTKNEVIYIPLVEKKAKSSIVGGTIVGPGFDKAQKFGSEKECKEAARKDGVSEEKIRIVKYIEKKPKDKFGHREMARLGLLDLAKTIASNNRRKIVVLPGRLVRKLVIGKRKKTRAR